MSSFAAAARASAIPPFHVMDLLARAQAREAAGHDVIHMEVGEPDFATPAPIVAAAAAALETGRLGYTPATGIPALRQAIASHCGNGCAAENIVVTPGASGALQLALLAILNVGDEVLLPDPGYPCNSVMVNSCGGLVRPLPCSAANHFQPTAEQVAALWGAATRCVVLASPANPAGTEMARDELAAICAVAAARGGWVVLDEIYSRLTTANCLESAFGLADNLICVNSFSKYHGMTGWRLGWLQIPAPLITCVERLAQNLFLAPSSIAQHAALAAFLPATRAICEQRRVEYNQRREKVAAALVGAGFTLLAKATGAFYLWLQLPDDAPDSFLLCQQLLEQANVVITPGCDFASDNAERFVRIAMTAEIGRLLEGVNRITTYLQSLGVGQSDS